MNQAIAARWILFFTSVKWEGLTYSLYSSRFNHLGAMIMSDAPKTRPKVPEGKSRFVTTRQKKANEKGYVGYDTIWEPFQKEVPYSTPKKP
jgi:hypothetical protein